ncbi:MAG: CDP-alcohol phosphatidyltransferase family protein [Bacillota bacterium]|nr:CDP-alcohol phosphatidyltransferase family protein [Bacillota bacterium]
MSLVKEIKKIKNYPQIKYNFLCGYLISDRISPYLSSMFIKRKVIPNKITLYMIYSGILGGILFSFANVWLKLLGAVFIHLWFILDSSDGEVARYTKTFSKCGREIDFIAHLINHPIFGFAMFMSLMQLGRYNIYFLAPLVFSTVLLDSMHRNLLTLNILVDTKENNAPAQESNGRRSLKDKISIFIKLFSVHPNLVLFGVIVYFIDYFTGTDILLWYIIIYVFFSLLFLIKAIIKTTKRFYTS